MRIRTSLAAAALLLGFGATANATIVGSTYDFSTAQTGNTVISPAPAPPHLVTGNPPAFCVGSTSVAPACAASSGVTVIPSFSTVSPTLDEITVFMAGSTAGAGPGSFTIDLANFVTLDHETVIGVSLASSAVGGATITDTFNGTDLILTWSTTSDFNAIGGASSVFNVRTGTAVPEPASLVTLGSALLGFGIMRRRRNRA